MDFHHQPSHLTALVIVLCMSLTNSWFHSATNLFNQNIRNSITSKPKPNSVIFQRGSSMSSSPQRELVQKLTLDDIDTVSSLMQDAFSVSNTHNWYGALNIPPIMGEYIKSYVDIPIQFKIGCYGEKVTSDSNKFKGIIINKELEPPALIAQKKIEIEDKVEISPYDKIDSIAVEAKLLFYNELHRRHYLRTEEYKCAHIAWIATDPQYRHQGVADRLIQVSINNIAQQNYDCAVVVCSNFAVTKAFEKHGFELWEEIEYKTFRFDSDNSYPFESLPDACNIMVKEFSKK